MREGTTHVLSIIAAVAIGGLIGSGVALLVAPQSGEKTRKLLRHKSMEFKEKALESASDTRDMLRDKSVELRDKALETASDTRERASKMLSDMAQQTKERVSSISQRIG